MCQRARLVRLAAAWVSVSVGSAASTREAYARAGVSGNRLYVPSELCSACTEGICGGVCDVSPNSRIIAMIELKSAAVCTSAIGFASRFTARPLTTSGMLRTS